MSYHIPALLNEAIDALNIKPDGIYVDATYGGGGHSAAILKRLENGHLYGFDQDIDAYKNASSSPMFTFVHGNFRYLSNFLRFYNVDKIDGVIADLGVSSHHFDSPERGFSFRFDSPMDMRMNQKSSVTAYDIINSYDETTLEKIFKTYGELKNARSIARCIVQTRTTHDIKTSGDLIDIVKDKIESRQEKKELSKLFQALRIVVNNELDALETFLSETLKAVRPGGRIAIISYHSLEDRMVKNFMKTGNVEGTVRQDILGNNLSPIKLLTSKPITPSMQEVSDNPRSRSAKLRIGVIIDKTA